jgi:hypothetical protein
LRRRPRRNNPKPFVTEAEPYVTDARCNGGPKKKCCALGVVAWAGQVAVAGGCGLKRADGDCSCMSRCLDSILRCRSRFLGRRRARGPKTGTARQVTNRLRGEESFKGTTSKNGSLTAASPAA